jgi:hypothetical protein
MKTSGGHHLLNDTVHWRARTEEMHRLAEEVDGPIARAAILSIAKDYEVLVARAEELRAGLQD